MREEYPGRGQGWGDSKTGWSGKASGRNDLSEQGPDQEVDGQAKIWGQWQQQATSEVGLSLVA